MTLSTPRGIKNGRLFAAYQSAEKHTEPADAILFPRGYHSDTLTYFVHCERFYAVLSTHPNLIISNIKIQ